MKYNGEMYFTDHITPLAPNLSPFSFLPIHYKHGKRKGRKNIDVFGYFYYWCYLFCYAKCVLIVYDLMANAATSAAAAKPKDPQND